MTRRISSTSPRLRFAAAAVLACALPAMAQTGAAAKVVVMTGRVSVLRDNAPWALNVGDAVQPRQIIVTGPDGYAQLKVADGSTFEVFANSQVTFRDNPGEWKDLLDVVIGRIKVHIQKLGGQPNHNRVRTPTAVIAVRGTIFDVVVDEADESTLVSVEEGRVAVMHLWRPSDKPRELSPGEWVQVFKNAPLAKQGIDKGGAIQRALRAAAQAAYEAIYRTSRPTAAGGAAPAGGGIPGGQPADTGSRGGAESDAPPPPPPPPPPPGG